MIVESAERLMGNFLDKMLEVCYNVVLDSELFFHYKKNGGKDVCFCCCPVKWKTGIFDFAAEQITICNGNPEL